MRMEDISLTTLSVEEMKVETAVSEILGIPRPPYLMGMQSDLFPGGLINTDIEDIRQSVPCQDMHFKESLGG